MMPIGPGKYDPLCTYVREEADALAAIVIVMHGKHGNGFSIQAHENMPPAEIANLLEQVVKELRRVK